MSPRVKKAVFLDRDGVLNIDHGYTYLVKDLALYAEVGKSLRALKDAGFKLIVVTNQSGIARGYFKPFELDQFHAAMQAKLENEFGVTIDRFYICPHIPEGNTAPYNISCDCRKPQTRHIETAIRELSIDRAQSFMVGDRESDIECGKKAGLKTIQIARETGAKTIAGADLVFKDLDEAAQKIISSALSFS